MASAILKFLVDDPWLSRVRVSVFESVSGNAFPLKTLQLRCVWPSASRYRCDLAIQPLGHMHTKNGRHQLAAESRPCDDQLNYASPGKL